MPLAFIYLRRLSLLRRFIYSGRACRRRCGPSRPWASRRRRMDGLMKGDCCRGKRRPRQVSGTHPASCSALGRRRRAHEKAHEKAHDHIEQTARRPARRQQASTPAGPVERRSEPTPDRRLRPACSDCSRGRGQALLKYKAAVLNAGNRRPPKLQLLSLHQSRARSSALQQQHRRRPCTACPSTQHPPNCPALCKLPPSPGHCPSPRLRALPPRARCTSEDRRQHSEPSFFAFFFRRALFSLSF